MNAAAHNINPPTVEFSGWERLRQAVARLQFMAQLENVSGSTKTLRTEQVGVLEDFRRFMAGIIEASETDESVDPTRIAFGRIILPPRTGKTVIAGQIIAATGLAAVFIASSRALASQIIRDLREQLPDIPVGTFTGEGKELVDEGVNVTTYNMLWQAFKRDEVPPQIRNAGIVFADEGHRSMTARRMKMLLGTFEQMVPRVALTATPDYHQEERQLVRYYPTLIHEITAPEAIELGLLAPTRVWVVEVDDDASKVELVAGDFNPVTVGRLMSHGPYFEAVRHFRYLQERGDDEAVNDNRSLSALICCVNRQQAYDLHKYLRERRPAGTPEPGLILGETTMEQRESLLARYDRGQIDTLITVNVLREGWNAPRCKLLITLAPTLSPVRAMQTYFRPMTKWGESEARIYVLVPKNLPYPPILPMDFFSADAEDYECGTLIGSVEQVGKKRYPTSRIQRLRRVPIERVELKSRILLAGLLVPPKLQRDDWDGVRQVLASALNLQHPPPNYLEFRRMFFQHRLFTGRGEQLLRYLKVPSSQLGYLGFLTRVMPEMVGALYLNKRDEQFANEAWCGIEASLRFTSHGLTRWEPEGAAESLVCEEWGMMTGTALQQVDDPLTFVEQHEEMAFFTRCLSEEKEFNRVVIQARLEGLSFKEIGETLMLNGRKLSRERVRQIEARMSREFGYHVEAVTNGQRKIQPVLQGRHTSELKSLGAPNRLRTSSFVWEDSNSDEGGYTWDVGAGFRLEYQPAIHDVTNQGSSSRTWLTVFGPMPSYHAVTHESSGRVAHRLVLHGRRFRCPGYLLNFCVDALGVNCAASFEIGSTKARCVWDGGQNLWGPFASVTKLTLLNGLPAFVYSDWTGCLYVQWGERCWKLCGMDRVVGLGTLDKQLLVSGLFGELPACIVGDRFYAAPELWEKRDVDPEVTITDPKAWSELGSGQLSWMRGRAILATRETCERRAYLTLNEDGHFTRLIYDEALDQDVVC